VLGISPAEAVSRLRQGDTAFLLKAAPEAGRTELESLARLHPSAPFYAALSLNDAALPGPARILFEISLDSPNALVRNAAARELFALRFRGEDLPEPVLDRLKTEAPDFWNKTLGLIAGPESPETARSLFFGSAGGLSAEALAYIRDQLQHESPGFFAPGEEAAIAGRLAASRSSFAEGLTRFRPALAEDPSLFFRYPELLNDLGRCFQYAAPREGLDLFLAWEQELAGNPADVPASSGPAVNFSPEQRRDARYRLLFFAGRFARQQGQLNRGAGLFAQALEFAPDARQEDACIWYILDAALQTGPEKAAALTGVWMLRWNEAAYFFDLLDRLSQYLTAKRDWAGLEALLTAMTEPGRSAACGPVIARYAYILGRAVSEGLYTPPGGAAAAGRRTGGADTGTGGERFFRMVLETGDDAPYYRTLAAAFLGEPPGDLPARLSEERRTGDGNRTLMEFLRGFFEYGAAPFAFSAIRDREADLSISDLRSLAGALETAGRYAESIRLAAVYMNRPGYYPNQVDLRLCYPQPFQKLVEQTARETGLRRELLFALIRTESAFQPDVVSRAGAVGLTQLMPATAADMAGRIKNRGGPDYAANGGPDLENPEVNVHIGAVYLNYLSGRLESPFLAILAYNGGMNRVRRWRSGEPELPADLFLETIPYAETREYGRKVLAAALIYGQLYYDLKPGPFFSDIFKSG
jgi:soluble lytic murein transglycosylase